MIKDGDEKFDPPLAKNRFLAKKGVKNPQNQPKTQPSRIELKFSG